MVLVYGVQDEWGSINTAGVFSYFNYLCPQTYHKLQSTRGVGSRTEVLWTWLFSRRILNGEARPATREEESWPSMLRDGRADYGGWPSRRLPFLQAEADIPGVLLGKSSQELCRDLGSPFRAGLRELGQLNVLPWGLPQLRAVNWLCRVSQVYHFLR